MKMIRMYNISKWKLRNMYPIPSRVIGFRSSLKQLLFICILLTTGIACKEKSGKQTPYSRMESFKDQNIVVTSLAKQGTFYREFESNGKLEAVQRATLNYELDENIRSVNVKNGQYVSKGQTLSELDNTQKMHSYEKSLRALERSKLSLEDALINMGYQLSDSASIPENMMKIALVRSGYLDTEGEKRMAAILLSKTKITAPFDGVVANLQAKAYNKSGQYKEFCTLIDNRKFEVEFPVLENEAFKLSEGMKVAVIPYAFDHDTINGFLSAINPLVSETGMVLAKAVVENKSGRLNDGMNVKVIVREAIPNKIIIPKSAVTLRQERKVVFVCKNDTARWRYVNVEEENTQFCTIKGEAIKPGEEVVIDGNFNLSHLAPVVKMNQ